MMLFLKPSSIIFSPRLPRGLMQKSTPLLKDLGGESKALSLDPRDEATSATSAVKKDMSTCRVEGRSQWSGTCIVKPSLLKPLQGFIIIPWTFFKRLIFDILVPHIARAILPMVGCCGCDLVGGLWCHCLVQHKNWSIADCMLYIWGLCWNNIHVQQP